MLALATGLGGCRDDATIALAEPEPTLTPDEGRDATDERLGQLSLALMRFAERHNKKLPNMTNIDVLKRDLQGYLNERPVGGAEIFEQAETGNKFSTNPHVSGKNIWLKSDGSSVVLIYQAQPSANDTRPVILGDGSFQRVGENEWPALKKQSGME
ncbi:MAG TPA: hypothetical protein VF627_14680 [Abditibacterium sp.]